MLRTVCSTEEVLSKCLQLFPLNLRLKQKYHTEFVTGTYKI